MATTVKNEVAHRDEAIKNGIYAKKTDWLIEEFQINADKWDCDSDAIWTAYYYISSKRQLFRGEIQNYHRSITIFEPDV